ncbi:osteopetrosis-associated transmembrane protein 1 [Rhinophrynus dorsalis]
MYACWSLAVCLLLCGMCLGSGWLSGNVDEAVTDELLSRSLWTEQLSLSFLPYYSLALGHSPDPHVCSQLLHEFANNSAALSECLVESARPVRVCEKCYSKYVQLQATMKSIGSPMQNGTDSCEISLLRSDRVQVMVTLNDFFEQIWDDSKCLNCLQNQSQGLLNSTVEFMNLFEELNVCFGVKEMVSAIQTQEGNSSTVCRNCSVKYRNLNALYSKLEQEKALCIDLEDAMNSTRRLWSKTFNCTVPCTDTVPVIAVSAFIIFLPIVFYLSSYLHSEQKKRKLILPKRIKSNANVVNTQDKSN